MRKSWAIYLLCLASAITVSMIRGGFISSMLFFMTLLVPTVSLALLAFTYMTFKVNQKIDKRQVVKGEEVKYSFEIYNNTLLAYCPMRIYFAGDQILFKDTILTHPLDIILHPGTVRNELIKLDCKFRGSYAIGIHRIAIRDYLNLFQINFKVDDQLKITVFPFIREIKKLDIHNTLSESTESIVSFGKFDASLFSNVRDYMAGDSMKNIHWKMSSKRNQLMTKEFEGSVNNKSKIIINSDSLPFSLEENIVIEEYVIETAVATIKYLLENNAPIDMFWHKYEAKREFANNLGDFAKLYDVLTWMVFSQHNFMDLVKNEMDRERGHSNYIIITPYVTDELSLYLIQKKRQSFNINVFIIDTDNSEYAACLKQIPVEAMYNLVSYGVHVYKIIFENGMCRLEVA